MEYDAKDTDDPAVLAEANEKICAMAKEKTIETLGKVLLDASQHMRNGFNLADN